MKANAAPMSVADYCHDFNAKKIIVNDEYQRNVGLWTAQARSFFIESILLEYPIPKLYLHARLDLKSRQQIKEIVDGQQRSQALVSFFNGKQRLTKNIDTEELRGLNYNQLDDEWKSKFLSYSLPIDQFSGAPEDEVREAFRRMNANNVPLNDEEQRNARYQGPFKWFIVELADKYKGALSSLGIFSRRDLIRMNDLKVYADILHTMDAGFLTIKGKEIDNLYKKYNATFPHEELYGSLVVESIEHFLASQDMQQVVFLRPHVFQTLILAIMEHRHPGTLPLLNKDEYVKLKNRMNNEGVPLIALAEALGDPDAHPQLSDFIKACTTRTNVESQRLLRFLYLHRAVS
jgi:hypothetical protein